MNEALTCLNFLLPLHYLCFCPGAISEPVIRGCEIWSVGKRRMNPYDFLVCLLDVLVRGIPTNAE